MITFNSESASLPAVTREIISAPPLRRYPCDVLLADHLEKRNRTIYFRWRQMGAGFL